MRIPCYSSCTLLTAIPFLPQFLSFSSPPWQAHFRAARAAFLLKRLPEALLLCEQLCRAARQAGDDVAAAEGEKLKSEVVGKMREEEEGERRSRDTRRKAEVRYLGECCEVEEGKGREEKEREGKGGEGKGGEGKGGEGKGRGQPLT